MPAAVAIPAAISGATSIVGGLLGSSASNKAANLQQQAAQQQAQQFQQQLAQYNPAIGTTAAQAAQDVGAAAQGAGANLTGVAGQQAGNITGAAGQANELLAPYLQAGGGANYVQALRGAGDSVLTSLWTSATAATIVTATGFFLAYLVERTGRSRRNLVDTALLLLFAAPGTILGIALILMWNRPGLTYLYASVAIVLIAYVAHYTPLAVRTIGVGFQAISTSVEEAARVGNGGWIRMATRVLLPLIAPAVAAAWALAFVFCLRDLDLVMTVHPPGVETLPIRLYTLMANSASSVTAALGVIMVSVTAACVLVIGVVLTFVRRISAWS